MTPQALKAFRLRVPDCELAVYADLGSGTVLGADGALRYPQEYVDALCASAAALFAAAPEGAQPDGRTASVDHVLVQGPAGCRGFFRRLDEPGEALCCICAPAVDTMRLIAEARVALAKAGAA